MNQIYFNVWFSAILQQQWTLQTNIIIIVNSARTNVITITQVLNCSFLESCWSTLFFDAKFYAWFAIPSVHVLDKTNHDVMKVIGNLNFDRFFRDVLY